MSITPTWPTLDRCTWEIAIFFSFFTNYRPKQIPAAAAYLRLLPPTEGEGLQGLLEKQDRAARRCRYGLGCTGLLLNVITNIYDFTRTTSQHWVWLILGDATILLFWSGFRFSFVADSDRGTLKCGYWYQLHIAARTQVWSSSCRWVCRLCLNPLDCMIFFK